MLPCALPRSELLKALPSFKSVASAIPPRRLRMECVAIF
jgi:hypothetical protein